ncbi:MAG: lysoplasmalogenase [Acidimicrobiales bacterium]|nr:lysoplasmalogenase [Acidimicrobiales bacterium]
MNATAFLLLSITVVVVALDWLAVATGRRPAELVLKPLAMVGLLGVALAIDASDPAARWAVVVAVVLSLVGDVCLMVRRDLFVPGLAAFLLAHLAYIVAFVVVGAWGSGLLVGAAVVAVAVVVVGPRILRGAAAESPALRVPVTAYLVAISAMVVLAFGTGSVTVVAGAVLFYLSDALIGWTRFVRDLERGRLAVMVTYHLGQILLVLGILLAA